MITLALIMSLSLGQEAALSAPPAPAALRRFALVAGANDGGSGRVTLRYATADALAIAKVMTSLGGVDPRDVIELRDPSVADLASALDLLDRKLKEAAATEHPRIEVFFYYSGHSDEEGLLLKGERLSYTLLRKRIDALPADIRIAVLDSCASGAMTLLKGGAPKPSFLVDASSSLTGHAFLTSASADEAAQESERLKASVFTHYFLSGLRGAADASRDGKVTLTEAYQYAFSQTLARTTSTQAGPQRPGYDIQLVGSGDLVLTDLRTSSARVVLEADLSGRVFVLGPDGSLIVEVAKAAGKSVELGLEPGSYKLVLDEGDAQVSQTQLELGAQSSKSLSRAGLSKSALEATVLRGDEPMPHMGVDVGFFPPLSMAGVMDRPPLVNFTLGVIASRVGAVHGLGVSSVVGWVDHDVNGIAVAGAFQRVGSLTGVGVSGGLLVSTGKVTGITASSILIANGDTTGLHTSVAEIIAGKARGMHLGVVSIATDGMTGLQAGTVVAAGGTVRGMQVGVVGYGGDVTGAQIGVVNIGGTVTGAQIGVLNIASAVHGLQLGVLNIAQTSDAPVGLLNIITKGHVHLAAWTNETEVANVALKLGGEYVYSLLEAGVNPRGTATNGTPHVTFGVGVGVRKSWTHWYGEVEVWCGTMHQPTGTWSATALTTGPRLNIGYKFVDGVAVFAGPQLNVQIGLGPGNGNIHSLAPWGFDPSQRVQLVPGVVLGAQFL